MLKGVLFDLGHTLQEFKSDDWPGIRRVMNSALYRYIDARGAGQNLPPLDEFLENLETRSQAIWDEARSTGRGRSLLSLLPKIFTQYGIEGLTPEECLAPWYDQRITEWIYVQPDVKPTLEYLRAQG